MVMARISTERFRGTFWCSALALAMALGAAVTASAHKPNFERPPEKAASPVVPELAAVTKRYREALEKKDLAAYRALHDEAVLIFEGGHKNVGWADYEKNHLGPELDALKTFRFTQWEEASRVFESTGLVVADIGYAMELNDGKTVEAKGVVTLVMRRKADGGWRVIHSHWSTQRPK